MLIRFCVRNFRSINEELELSMLPGKTRSHRDHIVNGTKPNEFSLLKASVLYGANAAGKSNIVEAIRFARKLIIRGTRPDQDIHFQRFRLNKDSTNAPARFEFEIQTKHQAYSYGFEITRNKINAEWLYEIGKTRQSKFLFERTTEADQPKIEINKKHLKLKEDDFQFLNFTARGTRNNQLFLTECKERNIEYFADVMNWFQEVLFVLPPPSVSHSMELDFDSDSDSLSNLVKSLKGFNLNISGIELQEIDDTENPSFATNIERLFENTSEEAVQIEIGGNHGRFILRKHPDGSVSCYKFVTTHKSSDGTDIEFEFNEESDGTIRLIDLLSGFLTSLDSERVFIVDELDRSLHPILSYNFIDFFLSSTKGFPNQLIVTTHESYVLDLELLRKDEIWFVEKDKSQSTTLYSLEEFTPRADKDIRRGYLHGRYGAIPIVRKISELGWGS